MFSEAQSIERDDPVLRARRTAGITRLALGVLGILLILAEPSLVAMRDCGIAGFGVIAVTSLLQLGDPEINWSHLEESLAASAAILIIGLGNQHVTIISLLWLVALATGVMSRGGRVGRLGVLVVLVAMVTPIFRERGIELEYVALCAAALGLQLTSGRLTLELNRLLGQARLEAENAETLLLAGDIASRVALRGDSVRIRPASPAPILPPNAEEIARTRAALGRLLSGDGLRVAVQPIVDLRSGRVHAYEALARFCRRKTDRSPLHWLSVAEELGERPVLERACLAAALAVFDGRPGDVRLSVNLSIPTLLEQSTQDLLEDFAASRSARLEGLIVEITEETLVGNSLEVRGVGDLLRERGAHLAVDDVGAGYSGLKQITEVLPDYLKLDRSLVAGIDVDADRAALVGAVAGYARHVGSLLVAEGVEHAAELRCLESLDVPLAQGFHLASPGEPWPGVDSAVLAEADIGLQPLGTVEGVAPSASPGRAGRSLA